MRWLASGLISAVFGFAFCLFVRPSSPHASLKCDIWALPTNATQADVTKNCGAPFTTNIYSADGHAFEQWVYDAQTFLWFRDGVFAFAKAPHQASHYQPRSIPQLD